MNQEQKIQIGNEDEINLMDYLNVILKRKRLIFLVFVLAIASVGVFSFVSPRIYKAEAVLEIGEVEKVAIEDPIQIIEKIGLGVYEKLVRKKLDILEENLRIRAENPRDTRLVKIGVEATQPELAKAISEEIGNSILLNHQEQIRAEKEFFKDDIERLRTKITSLEREREGLRIQIGILEKIFIEERTPVSQFILFSAKEKLEVRERRTEDLYLRISSLERLLAGIQPTKVIKAPLIPKAPIKPRLALNISIAGILGIFFGTFLAFSKEFLEKNKAKS